MDTIKGNGKRLTILVVSSVVLVAVITGVVVTKKNNDSLHRKLLGFEQVSAWVEPDPGQRRHAPSAASVPDAEMTPSATLRAVCSATQYPDWCFSSIASLEASENITDPEIFFRLSLQAAIQEHVKLIEYLTKLISQTNDTQVQEALKVCGTAFDDALGALNDSLSSMQIRQGEKLLSASKIDDINTRLTISMTYQQKCLKSLEELMLNASNSRVFSEIETAMKNSTRFAGRSLAICARILGLVSRYEIPLHRRLTSWVGPGKSRHAPGDQVEAGCCGGGGGGRRQRGPHHHQNGGG